MKNVTVLSSSARTRRDKITTNVAGVSLSHPGKALFPEAGLTKLSLANYYAAVAERILPHLEHRPLTLVRCPDGWDKECFYQKHADRSVHAAVSRVKVPEGDHTATYLAADSLPALVGLVQWGVIELHPWGARVPHLDKPDRLIFDFDPDETIAWSALTEGVKVLRALLDKLELTGFLKTTGGKGLHVVVPIAPVLEWPQVTAFAKAVAAMFAAAWPERYTATMSRAKRRGRIFIDYLRNTEGATAIAPYGIRARRNAPVAMPIGWDELKRDLRHDVFNVETALCRLQRQKKDPWRNFFSIRQRLTPAMFEQIKSEGSGRLVEARKKQTARR